MQTIGAYEAKTHLSSLLDQVENGEVIAITKHGRVVAILSPAGDKNPRAAAIAAIRRNRKGVKLGKNLTVKKMIQEGRR